MCFDQIHEDEIQKIKYTKYKSKRGRQWETAWGAAHARPSGGRGAWENRKHTKILTFLNFCDF